MEWTYNEDLQIWFSGVENRGCGVFCEKGRWEGNVVVGSTVVCVGPKNSMEEVQAEAEQLFEKLVAEQA